MSVHSPDNKIRPWLILSGAVENRNAIVRPGYFESGVRSLTFELYASAFHCDRVLRMFEECEVLCGAGTGNCCNVKEKVYILICILSTSVTTLCFLKRVTFKNQKFARVNSLWAGIELLKSRTLDNLHIFRSLVSHVIFDVYICKIELYILQFNI